MGAHNIRVAFHPQIWGSTKMRVDALPVRMDTQQQHVDIQRITMGAQQ